MPRTKPQPAKAPVLRREPMEHEPVRRDLLISEGEPATGDTPHLDAEPAYVNLDMGTGHNPATSSADTPHTGPPALVDPDLGTGANAPGDNPA